MATTTKEVKGTSSIYALSRMMAQVKMRPVGEDCNVAEPSEAWLWPGWLPLGHVTLLVGEPGVGKSLVALDLAARISKGLSWPDGQKIHIGPSQSALMIGEDFEWTVQRRLMAQEADLKRVLLVPGVEAPGDWSALDLNRRFDLLLSALKEQKDVRLIVLDPLACFTGKLDLHRPGPARLVMTALKTMAERSAAAVVAVTHLSKSQGLTGLARAMGSVSLAAAARSVYFVTRDPAQPDRRLMIPGKQNLTAESRALAWRIVADEQGRPKIQWEPDPVPDRLEDVLRADRDKSSPACDRACDFLIEQLSGGPKPANELTTAARQNGISFATMKRAKSIVGVRSIRFGFRESAGFRWQLPDELKPVEKASGSDNPA